MALGVAQPAGSIGAAAGFIGAAAKLDTGGPKASTGRRFHGPGADICWRQELKTGADWRGGRAGGGSATGAAQVAARPPGRHRAGSAPRGLGTARARRRSGTAKGSAPQRARRKSGSTARTWDRKGAALPVNDGVGAQAGAPHHKRAGAGNLPQRRGPSRPGAAGSNRATRRKETPTAK